MTYTHKMCPQVHSHDWMQHNVAGATQECGGESLMLL